MKNNTIKKCLFPVAGHDTRFLSATKAIPKEDDNLERSNILTLPQENIFKITNMFKGKRFDCGSVDGFVEATNYFYNKEK